MGINKTLKQSTMQVLVYLGSLLNSPCFSKPILDIEEIEQVKKKKTPYHFTGNNSVDISEISGLFFFT